MEFHNSKLKIFGLFLLAIGFVILGVFLVDQALWEIFMNEWIDNETVEKAQTSGDMSSLVESGVPFCISPDRTYCIVVRNHAAWYVDGEGWRAGNYPPEGGESGRPMLNFFKRQVGEESGFWFKVFIPKAVTVGRIAGVDEEFCEAMINSERHVLSYDRIDRLMWDCVTGHAESEKEIEEKFEKIWNR